MKKLLTVVIIALCAAACGSGRQKPDHVAGGDAAVFDISPEILRQRTDTTVWIGKLRAGEVVRYDAWLRNTGEVPLVITKVETSCGCTSVEYERKPIPPGGKGRFSFRYDSRGMWGMQLKTIEIRTSAGQRPYVLYVQAEVESEDFL